MFCACIGSVLSNMMSDGVRVFFGDIMLVGLETVRHWWKSSPRAAPRGVTGPSSMGMWREKWLLMIKFARTEVFGRR